MKRQTAYAKASADKQEYKMWRVSLYQIYQAYHLLTYYYLLTRQLINFLLTIS
jgi:hypothetical protein